MEYQKIMNFLDHAPNQPFKFKTKNWVETNNDARETYNTNSQIIFKTSMLKSNLCVNKNNKQGIFKNSAPFTNSITETNNTQVDNAKDLDVAMPNV